MPNRYPVAQIDFLKHGFKLWRIEDLVLFFNAWFGTDKTRSQIKSTLTNHKITCGRPPGFNKGTLRAWTKEQAEFLKVGYQSMAPLELTGALNAKFGTAKSPSQVRCFLHNRGITSGRDGRFHRGHKPWNNGTKGWRLTGANRGSFKKGNIPQTHLPVGSEILNSDGYWRVKIAEPNVWRHKHVMAWEAENGPLPPGMILRFIDNNHDNCSPDNLEPITRSEHVRLNQLGYAAFPAELQPTVRVIARISMRAGELKKRSRKHKPTSGVNP